MCKKHQDQLVHLHVHPPFPSFAWVMTAQANPPTPAYAYGYIQNAQALRTRPPAHCATPEGRHQPYPRSSRPPPSPTRAKVEGRNRKFMDTVDYRYYDGPPSRPYVPWLEGHISQECGTQQAWQRQQALLPLDLTIAAQELCRAPPAVATRDSNCGFAGGSDNVRPTKRMNVDVVKFKRLDIALNALRRACGLSVRA